MRARLRIDMRSFHRFLVIIGLKKVHRNTSWHCVLFLFTFYSVLALLVNLIVVYHILIETNTRVVLHKENRERSPDMLGYRMAVP